MKKIKIGDAIMASSERKKMTDVYILEILRKYTDGSVDADGNGRHCLTQAEIRKKLLSDYDISLDRKAVSRGLDDLISAVPEISERIEFDSISAKKASKDEDNDTEKSTNFRYCQEFDDYQIRLLTEAILFSKNIPQSEAQEMIEKLSALGGIDSRRKLSKNLCKLKTVSQDRVTNQQILNNIGVIDEAIEKGRQITFIYNDYGTDKKLHPRKLIDGKPMRRQASPYMIVAGNERYYLVCNYNEYDNALKIRIDKLTDIEITAIPSKPKKNVRGLKESAYTMAELLYMQPGEPERIVIKASKQITGALVDWFGKNIRFSREDENGIVCEVKVTPKAMRYWAMQYCEYVEVLEPESLREDIKDSVRGAWKKYNGGMDSLIESPENISKLCDSWNKICNDTLNDSFNIKDLEETVKQTHNMLIPFRGKEIKGQYCELVFNLNNYSRKTRLLRNPKAFAVSLIIDGILDDLKNGEKYAAKGLPDNIIILRFIYETDGRRQFRFEFDKNAFEDDFLTLLHHTSVSAVKAEKSFAEMNEKIRQRREERRKKQVLNTPNA